MDPYPDDSPRHRGASKTRSTLGWPGVFAVVFLAGVVPAWLFLGRTPQARNDSESEFHIVKREPLAGHIVVKGNLESAKNTRVVCRAKSLGGRPLTIRWIIEDGSNVQKGDLLMQLDDAELSERLRTLKIDRDIAEARWAQACQDHDLVVAQNKNDVARARQKLELAKLDQEAHLRGEFPKKIKDIEGRLSLARNDLDLWKERSDWSNRMAQPSRRYVSQAQARADEARLKSARIAVEQLEEEQRLCKKFTGPRAEKELLGRVEEARRALDRTIIQGEAREVRDFRIRNARYNILRRHQLRCQDLQKEIDNCRILAPHSGMVVYSVSSQNRYGAGSQQAILAQGEPVREGQLLMVLPNMDSLGVDTLIPEALIARVHGEHRVPTGFTDSLHAGGFPAGQPFGFLGWHLGFLGMEDEIQEHYHSMEHRVVGRGHAAEVQLEAFPDQVFPGEVVTVSSVASAQDAFLSDVNLYQAFVGIRDSIPGWKPGMSALVKIFTDSENSNSLTIPLQAILPGGELGHRQRVQVLTESGPEYRDILVGHSDGKKAEILSGLREGEKVLLDVDTPHHEGKHD